MKSARFHFRSWTLWCGFLGGPDTRETAPVIFVPGGPGMPHHSFLPLARLAPAHRILLYYDPTGSGSSDKPTAISYDLDMFVDELEAMVAELKLPRFHLYGSSFGGLVCLAFALRKPPGLVGMTLSGASPSYPATRAAVRRKIDLLPELLREPLLATTGKFGGLYANSAVYAKAYHEYGARFMCRVGFPPPLALATRYANMDAMIQMKGRGLMYDGTLRELDMMPRMKEIEIPTLLAYGAHDALYPEVAGELHRELRGSRLEVFPDSSHMPQFEEEAAFARTLYSFMDEIDGPRG